MRRRSIGIPRARTGPCRALVLLAGTVAVGAIVGGCSHGRVNDAGAYCALLDQQRPQLDAPIASTLDIAPRISVYQQLHDRAPLAVQPQWQSLLELLNAASTVDLGDQKAVSALHDQALAATIAATEIVKDAATVCNVTLPAVGTLAPPSATIAAPPTT